MKLRYVLVAVAAIAGFGASFALADDGHHGDKGTPRCKRGIVVGHLSAPQSLTLTVDRANDRSGLKADQVITVSLGSQGQQVRLVAGGCVGADGTLTVKEAELHVAHPRGHKGDGGTTTTTTTSSTSTAQTTTSGL
ncbi:MAG TPA: hypothetical protein VGC78_14010 [Gaiellaceae bacterium]|jgi:hypothetical protein